MPTAKRVWTSTLCIVYCCIKDNNNTIRNKNTRQPPSLEQGWRDRTAAACQQYGICCTLPLWLDHAAMPSATLQPAQHIIFFTNICNSKLNKRAVSAATGEQTVTSHISNSMHVGRGRVMNGGSDHHAKYICQRSIQQVNDWYHWPVHWPAKIILSWCWSTCGHFLLCSSTFQQCYICKVPHQRDDRSWPDAAEAHYSMINHLRRRHRDSSHSSSIIPRGDGVSFAVEMSPVSAEMDAWYKSWSTRATLRPQNFRLHRRTRS